MTRHESRRPSSKATGPSVPVANLPKCRHQRNQGKRHTHDKMFVFADSHIKNILIKCVSVLSSTEMGWIPIKWRTSECGSRYGGEHSLIRIDQVSEVEIRYAPRASTPQDKSFSERKRVALEAGAGVRTCSNEFLSPELFVEPSLFSESSIVGLKLRLEAEGKRVMKKVEGS